MLSLALRGRIFKHCLSWRGAEHEERRGMWKVEGKGWGRDELRAEIIDEYCRAFGHSCDGVLLDDGVGR